MKTEREREAREEKHMKHNMSYKGRKKVAPKIEAHARLAVPCTIVFADWLFLFASQSEKNTPHAFKRV